MSVFHFQAIVRVYVSFRECRPNGSPHVPTHIDPLVLRTAEPTDGFAARICLLAALRKASCCAMGTKLRTRTNLLMANHKPQTKKQQGKE